jgi:hypothetical protein
MGGQSLNEQLQKGETCTSILDIPLSRNRILFHRLFSSQCHFPILPLTTNTNQLSILTPMNDKELKRKITERWNILSNHQNFNPFADGPKITVFAQLEYILIEAGLLAQRRKRLSERAMRHGATETKTTTTIE